MSLGPRLKDLGRWSTGGTPPRDHEDLWDGDLPWISAKDFEHDHLREPTTYITAEAGEEHSRIAPPGSIVMIVRGMALAHGLPVAQTGERVAFNQDLRAVAVFPRFDQRYIYFAIRGSRPRLNAHIDRAAHGTARLSDSVMVERIRVPALSEQRRTAEVLEDECNRIGGIKRALNDQVRDLQEWEEARLEEAIWKPGGRLQRLKYLTSVITSGPRGWSDYEAPGGETPFIGIGALNKRSLSLRLEGLRRLSPPKGAERLRAETKIGDILMSITADLGTIGVVTEPFVGAVVSQHVALIRPVPERASARWLAFALKTARARGELQSSGYGGSKQGLGLAQVAATRVPVVHPEEQRATADVLTTFAKRMDNAVAECRLADFALGEYRDALITEAVAGKLDVTHVSDQQLDESAHAAMEGERPEVLSA